MDFQTTEIIGTGTFGTIYKGTSPQVQGPVAIKIIKDKHKRQLLYEYRVYQILGSAPGIPIIYGFGSHAKEDQNYLIMQLFKSDLCTNATSSPLKVRAYMTRMISVLQYVHEHDIVHRDIKPENIMLDFADNVHLVDFGLSKRYCDPQHKTHIPYNNGRRFTGTPRYASINTHMGIEQTRRDDMISLGYVCIFMIKGALPWQGLNLSPTATQDVKNELILKRKLAVPLKTLCDKTLPGMLQYMEYVTELDFDQAPDYAALIDFIAAPVQNPRSPRRPHPSRLACRTPTRNPDNS